MSALPSTDTSFALSPTYDLQSGPDAMVGGVTHILKSRGFLVSSVLLANAFVWVGLIKLATIVF